MANLPSSASPSLILAHPRPAEIHKTHELSSTEWAGAIATDQYIENEHDLASLLNITHWILTPADLPPSKRPILASCETIRKRCFVTDKDVGVKEAVLQAVAAVFCEPEMRGRGYAGRMLRELGTLLREKMDEDGNEVVGSILFSDIGPKYYANLGWTPFASTHVEIPAFSGSSTIATKAILAGDIAELCTQDQALLLDSLGRASGSKTLLTVVPDHQTILWHHMKEDYICQKLFGRQPSVKGAIAGESRNRVWEVWTRGYYGLLDDPDSGNMLHILRLVIENPDPEDLGEQTKQVKVVLQAAQHEAAEWKLHHVEIWNPDERTKELIQKTRIDFRFVERQTEGIPSLMWFSEGGTGSVEWFCEKFAWC